MSVSINSQYANAINTYSSNQKAGNEKPTLEQLQERVSASEQNIDFLEITKVDSIPQGKYAVTFPEYQEYFMYAVNAEDALSLYQSGRENLIKNSLNAETLEVHLTMFDNAFENQMGKIADKVALDLYMQRQNREQEAIYIPKTINRYEQLRDNYLKNGQTNAANILTAEIERLNARLANKDSQNKLAVNKDFNIDEFSKNSSDLMREYARAITQNMKSGMDSVSAQKSAFEFMLESFNKTTSVNNLSFKDFMAVYNHSDYVAFMNGDFAKPKPITEAMRNEIYRDFNAGTELSAELRALLG